MISRSSASGFTQPHPGLHTGGQPKPEQLAELSDSGVHTVIDLRDDANSAYRVAQALPLGAYGLSAHDYYLG